MLLDFLITRGLFANLAIAAGAGDTGRNGHFSRPSGPHRCRPLRTVHCIPNKCSMAPPEQHPRIMRMMTEWSSVIVSCLFRPRPRAQIKNVGGRDHRGPPAPRAGEQAPVIIILFSCPQGICRLLFSYVYVKKYFEVHPLLCPSVGQLEFCAVRFFDLLCLEYMCGGICYDCSGPFADAATPLGCNRGRRAPRP